MRNVKLVVSLFFVGVVVIFVAQNVEVVSVAFLGWSFQTHRAFLIFGVLAIGIGAGWILRGSKQAGARRESAPRRPADPPNVDAGTDGEGPAP